MNFISRMESAQVQVELKYCERCGGLFLRPQAAEVVYCGGCAAHLMAKSDSPDEVKAAPAPRGRVSNPRMVKGPKLRNRELRGAAQIPYLEGVEALEVRA